MKWFIPDCYWPAVTTGETYVSHEAICVLNTNDEDADITITLYFEDRDPIDGIQVTIPARRTKHVRMDLLEGQPVPKGTPYAAVVECDKEISVQYTRVDTSEPALAICTSII